MKMAVFLYKALATASFCHCIWSANLPSPSGFPSAQIQSFPYVTGLHRRQAHRRQRKDSNGSVLPSSIVLSLTIHSRDYHAFLNENADILYLSAKFYFLKIPLLLWFCKNLFLRFPIIFIPDNILPGIILACFYPKVKMKTPVINNDWHFRHQNPLHTHLPVFSSLRSPD